MTGIDVSRENGLLVAKGAGDAETVAEAVRAFVAAENTGASGLTPLEITLVPRLAWHSNYIRSAWPDKDPPLEVVEVWITKMMRRNAVVFYRCQDLGCLRCHNPDAPWSSHLKIIRPDGNDAIGAAVEVEVRRGKKRETIVVLVDQPVFVPAKEEP